MSEFDDVINTKDLRANKARIGISTPSASLSGGFIVFTNDALTDGSAGLVIEQAGTGDASIKFGGAGYGTNWIIGPDNNQNYRFIINVGSSLNANTGTGLTISTAGAVSMTSNGTFGFGAGALLTMNSTTQGFLPPIMTSAQMQAISNPAAGLMVYNSTSGGMYIQTSGGAWAQIVTAPI